MGVENFISKDDKRPLFPAGFGINLAIFPLME